MPYRSPFRWLAPLALIASLALIYAVAKPELDRSSTTAKATSSTTRAKAPAKPKKAATSTAKTYTVKKGDVLGTISEATGVAVSDLEDLNDVDAQTLRVGQKLKLAP